MTIEIGNIILVCTAITGIAAVIGLGVRFVKPFTAWKKEIDGKLEKDYTAIKALHVQQCAMISAMLAILSHLEDGNSTGAMRAARNELTEALTFKLSE
jgi:hypothetical protein